MARAVTWLGVGMSVRPLRPAMGPGIAKSMTALRATVRAGHLVLDVPTNLPEGTEVALVPVDGWDDLDGEDRRRLHEALLALLASEDDIAYGRAFTAEEVLAELRSS